MTFFIFNVNSNFIDPVFNNQNKYIITMAYVCKNTSHLIC